MAACIERHQKAPKACQRCCNSDANSEGKHSGGQHMSNALARAGFMDARSFALTRAILLKTRSVGALDAGIANFCLCFEFKKTNTSLHKTHQCCLCTSRCNTSTHHSYLLLSEEASFWMLHPTGSFKKHVGNAMERNGTLTSHKKTPSSERNG